MKIEEWSFDGTRGRLAARVWSDDERQPRHVVLIAHGYGEHIGRYDHVAAALVDHGAIVYGLDHMGHGKSDGERVLIEDFEEVVADLHTLSETARRQSPGLPVVLIGHSMGGLIAARYAQHHGDTLKALVLSGPAIGEVALIEQLRALDEIPDIALDPATLSRDARVGEEYAADPLVWHGAFKRPTLDAFGTTIEAINNGGSIGDLPLLWIHGVEDPLVAIDGSRAGIERLRGATFRSHEYDGARHEVFNELGKEETIALVADFAERVTRARP